MFSPSTFQNLLGWEPSDRGVSFKFGPDVVQAFLERNNISLIVRAHQVGKHLSLFVLNRQFHGQRFQFSGC